MFDKNNIKKIRKDINIVLFSGEADPVGDYGHGIIQSVRIYKDAGIKNVDFKIYPQARHEILNEINNKEVYDDILN
ncbi:MAG: alpha/beta hydrolase, partial [Arcobacter sp.]|nr:alpha/beta hydrolase [Arcobacter sp.]